MKKSLASFVERFLFGTMIVGVFIGLCCTPAQRSTVRTVFDVVEIACILANAESDDETVLRTCRIANDLLPDLKDLLAAQRRAAEQYARHQKGACAKGDAGAEGPGK